MPDGGSRDPPVVVVVVVGEGDAAAAAVAAVADPALVDDADVPPAVPIAAASPGKSFMPDDDEDADSAPAAAMPACPFALTLLIRALISSPDKDSLSIRA